MKIDQIPSPNFNARADGTSVRYIVLHYTGMPTAAEALKRMIDPTSQVSAHYMIDEDGVITQMVDEAKRAWHAGKSCWRGERDINSASIGIELVNPGHAFGYVPFAQGQIIALEMLLQSIIERHALPADCLLAHSDVAPDRKEDPGELFPWRDLAAKGFGLWPAPSPEDQGPAKDGEITQLLLKIGYDTTGEQATDAAVTAFQRRYRPSNIDGFVDDETLALLRALAREL